MNMEMRIVAALLIVAVWIYLLYVTKHCKLYFWNFIVGSFGLFIMLMVWVRPVVVQPLSRVVAALAGLFGDLTGTFTAFFKYGILFIETTQASISLQIDFECSGIIEIIAFLSLLSFFAVYTARERILVGVMGCLAILVSNVIRVIVICEIIHFFGPKSYYVAHSVIGRIVFYFLSVLLYFYAFTKPQIVKTRLGKFSYGNN